MNDLDKLFDVLKSLGRQKEKTSPVETPSYASSFLIAGLGNPGREYRDTRHNIGFSLVDKIAQELGVQFSRTHSKALVTDGIYVGNKIILVKPQTYMNKSGHAVQSLVKFYKLDLEKLLVAYDDVDLPFGTIRLKPSGGSGGHKGMRSIIAQLGTQNFSRLRLGVGRPPATRGAANYVLKPFKKQESEILPIFLAQGVEAAFAFTTEGIEYAMTNYNKSTSDI